MLAKSFQDFEILCDPYEVAGKAYVRVRHPRSGNERQVRWYTEKEYTRLYGKPEKPCATDAPIPPSSSLKEVLGFELGYINLVIGDVESCQEYLCGKPECRFTTLWGWYIISTEQVPEDLPTSLRTVKLEWSEISSDGVALNPENIVRQTVEGLLYEPSNSQWIGKVGERLDMTLTVTANHAKDNYRGTTYVHYFTDADGNVLAWSTASQNWPAGASKRIRATIRSHEIYKNNKVTWLTRCMESK